MVLPWPHKTKNTERFTRHVCWAEKREILQKFTKKKRTAVNAVLSTRLPLKHNHYYICNDNNIYYKGMTWGVLWYMESFNDNKFIVYHSSTNYFGIGEKTTYKGCFHLVTDFSFNFWDHYQAWHFSLPHSQCHSLRTFSSCAMMLYQGLLWTLKFLTVSCTRGHCCSQFIIIGTIVTWNR